MDTHELILRHLNGEASPAEFAELERRLAADRSARRKLVIEVGIDADLREIAREGMAAPVLSTATPRSQLPFRARAWAFAVAAAFLLAVFLGGWCHRIPAQLGPSRRLQTSNRPTATVVSPRDNR